MGSATNSLPTPRLKRGFKQLIWAFFSLALILCVLYAWVFLHVMHPRLVRVVDAISGRPIPGLNVCLQSFARGWGERFLTNKLSKTNWEGLAFFRQCRFPKPVVRIFDRHNRSQNSRLFSMRISQISGFRPAPALGADQSQPSRWQRAFSTAAGRSTGTPPIRSLWRTCVARRRPWLVYKN